MGIMSIKTWLTQDNAILQSEIEKAERKPWILHLALQTENITGNNREKDLKLFLKKAYEVVESLNSIHGAEAELEKSTGSEALINIKFTASKEQLEKIMSKPEKKVQAHF
jgi:hypothetical protein